MYNSQNVNSYINIKFKTDESPKDYSFVLTSIDSKGNQGPLNEYIFRELELSKQVLPDEKDLLNGFKAIKFKSTVILFIVTEDGNSVNTIFRRNLRAAFRQHIKDLNWPIWIPLMATGAYKLKSLDSFLLIAKELEANNGLVNKGIDVVISLSSGLDSEVRRQVLKYTSESEKLNLINLSYSEINFQNEPFKGIVEEKEFYLLKVQGFIQDLKQFGERYKSKTTKKKNLNVVDSNPLLVLKELWVNQGRPHAEQLLDDINQTYPYLKGPFNVILGLLSHVDRYKIKGERLNKYVPKRFVTETDLQQLELLQCIFDWIKNDFQVSIEDKSNQEFARLIFYLEDPLTFIPIVKRYHGEWISKNLIGAEVDGESFEDEIFDYFVYLNREVVNPVNYTYLITAILYHQDFRYQWDEEMGVVGKTNKKESKQYKAQSIDEIELPDFDEPVNEIKNVVEDVVLPKSEPPEVINNPLQRAILNSDSAHKGQDLLGFQQDIEAFASIVALKELTPPLAIALFGQWGTGKSFFMQKLSEKVEELAETQGFEREVDGKEKESADATENKPFCEGVCQIHFNAWSYMDTNLWASLVTQIFEGLDQYINRNSSEGEKEKEKIRKKIAKRLDVAKGQRALLAEKKIKARHSLNVLNSQVDVAKKALKLKVDAIKTASKKKAITEAIEKSGIETSLEQILEEAGLSKEDLAAVNPDLILKELKSVQSFAHQFLQFSWKDWIWFIAGVGLFALPLLLESADNTKFEGLESLGGVLTVVIGALTKVRQTSAKLSPLINGVVKIKSDYDQAIAQATNQFEQEVLAMRIEADQLEAELQQVTQKLKDKEAEIEALNITTETVLARKAMYNFITNKAASTDYSRHLGIISMIRKAELGA